MKILIYTLIIFIVILLLYLIWQKHTGKTLNIFNRAKNLNMKATDLIFAYIIIKNKEKFLNRVIDVSNNIGLVNPNHLMAVMFKESALNSKARNPVGGATGLIQFMPDTAKGLGTTTDALYAMDNVIQLDYVEKYFLLVKKWTKKELHTYEDLYLATFWPAALGKPDDFIIQSAKMSKELIALQNKSVDLNKDSKITVGEFREYTRKRLGNDILSKLK